SNTVPNDRAKTSPSAVAQKLQPQYSCRARRGVWKAPPRGRAVASDATTENLSLISRRALVSAPCPRSPLDRSGLGEYFVKAGDSDNWPLAFLRYRIPLPGFVN